MARIIGRQAGALRELRTTLAQLETLNPDLARLVRKLMQENEPTRTLRELRTLLAGKTGKEEKAV
jgi:hypothetical protein